MRLAILLALFACCLSIVEGGCTESYLSSKTCYKSERNTRSCWLIFRCSKYRQVSYNCDETLYRCCDNWTGTTCSKPICHGSTSCPNGGECESPNQCSCTAGFASPQCADVNECANNNGGCQQICTNTHGSFKCSCRSGYIMNSDQKTCSAICHGSTSCPNGGECESPNQCSCTAGFAPPECADVNECYIHNGGCQQKCENLLGTFRCACDDGYVLNGDGKTCTDKDECIEDKTVCQHNCTNTIGSFTCSCAKGYSLALDKVSCADEDECTRNQVCAHQCHNTDGSYYCSCKDGYFLQADETKCLDVNECDEDNGRCQHTCVNTPGSYMCTCLSGYTLNEDQQSCDDIDECTKGISGCSHGCNNTIGSYVCDCPQGFRLDSENKICKDIDDCDGKTCNNGGTCVDGFMFFSCLCRDGYTGEFCQTDKNECDILNGGCQDICTNTDGSFNCSCSDNRTLSSNGITCKGSSPSDTVFKKHNIIGKGLPKGCWTIELAKCKDGKELNLTLSSTSEWFLFDSTERITISYGIVFIEVNKIAIPVSLEGVEVHEWPGNFQLRIGVREAYSGVGSVTGMLRSENCLAFNFSSSDKFEFIEAGSFMNSLFVSILASLPNWVQFESGNASVINVQDLKTDLIYGSDISNDNWCKGAPVFPDHLYSVFKFGSSFALEIYGQTINVPSSLSGEKFCLIIDICQSYGATIFLMLPKESRGLLSKISSFRTLFEKNGFYLEPRGIALSFANGINAHHQKTELTLWNGDEFFNYRISQQASFWIGGDLIYNKSSSFLHAEGKADVFLSIPNINRILTAVFIDEWSGLVSVQAMATATLKFKLFKKQFDIAFTDILTGGLDTYMSIGGTEERLTCGQSANPSGIFFSAMLKINPFQNVPVIKDWLFDNTHRVYAFFMSDPRSSLDTVVAIDIVKDILDLQGTLERIKSFLSNIFDDINDFISSNISVLIQKIALSAGKVVDILPQYLPDIRAGSLTRLVDVVDEIWRGINTLKDDVRSFLDSAELFVDVLSDNVAYFVQTEIETVKENFNKVLQRLNQQVSNLVEDYDGFGLKYHVTIKLFGLKIAGLDVEFVYSTHRMFSCSRFDSVYKLFEGKAAARFLVRVSQEKQLGYFLKIDRGGGFGMAFAIESDEVVAQLEVFASLLGVRVTADLFITNRHLALYTELNVWDIFLAQVDVIAEHGKDWYELTLHVRGRFVAKARKKRQIQTKHESFQSSYFDALKEVVRVISNEADKRLSQAQNALTDAQSGLTKAQRWLEEKKEDVRRANGAFDKAVESLETAKRKLEEAKEPYKNAIRKLEAAQRTIDNLCKIRSCRKICIPGIKCKICWKKVWGVKIPYPCCRLTDCMISFPDPICVLANLVCRAIRALVYLALEVAKILVRVVMLAYDVAILAVSVAQVIVDKSRIVLDLAEGVLTLAQIGLEGAKGVLEVAKIALEAVKIVIGVAAKVLEFVIEYGIKTLLDVRNCGFEIELSTTDLPVFDISCEVNAFMLGWKTVGIRINFKNVFQSIWQAAKATIKAILDGFGGLLSGRKRRDILFSSTSMVHTFLRNVRSADLEGGNATTQAANDFIDTLVYTDGFDDNYTFSDYGNRVKLFQVKCVNIANVLNFLNETFSTLFDIANETNMGVEDALSAKAHIQNYNVSEITNNMTLQEAGIDSDYAMQDYNISEADLDEVLETSKNKSVSDPMMNEINSIVELSSKSIDAEITAAESVQILNQWMFAMENTTNGYFNESECVKFRDCVHHSIALLYDLYTEENIPEIEAIQSAIASLEDYILDVFQNSSSSISNTFNASMSIMADIEFLSNSNLFCSKAPVFTVETQNYTAIVGSNAAIQCHVFSEPEPTFWWYKDGEYILDLNTNTITIENVTTEDAAVYQCMAGNIVANITSDEVHLIIIQSPQFSPEDEKGFPILTVILVAGILCAGVVITTIVTLIICCASRSRNARRRGNTKRRRHVDRDVKRDRELYEVRSVSANRSRNAHSRGNTEGRRHVDRDAERDRELYEVRSVSANRFDDLPMERMHMYDNQTYWN